MDLLTRSGAEAAFAAELGDVIGSIAGVPVQVDLTEAPHLPQHGALVTALSDVSTSPEPGPEVANPSSVVAELSQSNNHVLELMLADERHPIDDLVSIGRSSSCDISIADPEMSRRHAEVSRRNGAVIVQDLGSTNGTQVNGRIINAPTALAAGDVILIGNTEISVVSS
jgi:hypothetical protein